MEFQDLKGKKAVVTGAGAGENDLETNSNMYLYRQGRQTALNIGGARLI